VKSEKIGAKFVRTTSTIYKRAERKLLPQHFTPRIVDMQKYKIFRYLVTGCHKKLSSSYRYCQKRTVGPTFVRTEKLSLLSRAIKNILGAFIGDDL